MDCLDTPTTAACSPRTSICSGTIVTRCFAKTRTNGRGRKPSGSIGRGARWRQTIETKLGSALGLADELIDEVQTITSELRPRVLDNLGLPAAIEFETRRFQQRSGLVCELTPLPLELPPAPEQATAIFRIFEEILTNIARHAQATHVRIRLGLAGDDIELEVSDNGRGIRPEELADPKSLGLFGMQERATLLGGQLSICGEPGRGTVVRLTLPARRPPAEERR